ncbi:Intercellular adhesion molecule 2 [Apodemus speciosus]|uniref:Intercellular adhesion molecule 2 n=1 Tax=Apodemus speciosus TaxID=105296 RepID=A0ABQ0FCM6_APOSI
MGSGEKAFEVYIWSEKQIVKATESWKVNCSTSCAAPEAGGLETSVDKIMLEEHPQGKWKQFLVSNASNDTVFYCHFTCSGKQHMESLNISVYPWDSSPSAPELQAGQACGLRICFHPWLDSMSPPVPQKQTVQILTLAPRRPPTQVTLKLQPPRVFVGEDFTIECKVSPVKPLERLTLSLLRGRETLKNQTFGGAETVPQEATATFNSTALEKDGLNFSCQAELDLRSHGGFIVRSFSESQILEVYELVQDNQLLIIIVAVSILLFLFVTSILLCFILGQHWHRRRTGAYGVLAAWRRLPRALRGRPM